MGEYPFCWSCVHVEDGLACDECEQGNLYEVNEDLIVEDDEGRMTLNKQVAFA